MSVEIGIVCPSSPFILMVIGFCGVTTAQAGRDDRGPHSSSTTRSYSAVLEPSAPRGSHATVSRRSPPAP